MEFLITRLTQPSTWRGLILLATAFGVKLEPDLQESIIAVGLAAVGLINVLRNEHKATRKVAATVAADVAEHVAEQAVEEKLEPLPWQTPGEAAAYRAGLEAGRTPSNTNQPPSEGADQ